METLTERTRVQCLWKRREIDQITETTMFGDLLYPDSHTVLQKFVVKLTFLVSFKYGLQIQKKVAARMSTNILQK